MASQIASCKRCFHLSTLYLECVKKGSSEHNVEHNKSIIDKFKCVTDVIARSERTRTGLMGALTLALKESCNVQVATDSQSTPRLTPDNDKNLASELELLTL